MNKIVEDLDYQKYREHPSISQSDLKNLAKCPIYYTYKKKNPCDTDAMKMGRMVHSYILEKEKFENEYFITPKITRRGEKWEEIQKKSGKKEIVFKENLERAKDMRNMLLKLGFFKDVLEKSSKEISVFWQDSDVGIDCKARIDGYSEYYNVLYDLKTTTDCIDFRRSFFKYKYHIQAAYYMDAIAQVTSKMPKMFIIFAIEKEPPYLCKTYIIDNADETINVGREEYKCLLNYYSECERKKEFDTAFENDVDRIDYMPNWYNKFTLEEF